MKKLTALLTVTGLILGISASSAAEGETGAEIDEKSQKTLRKMSALFKDLERFTTTRSFQMHVQRANGRKNATTTEHTLAVEFPDKIAYIQQKGAKGLTLVSDGKKVTTYVPSQNSFTVNGAPEKLHDLKIFSKMSKNFTMNIPLLITENPYETIIRHTEKITYVGKENLEDVTCHVLNFEQKRIDCKLWIEAGEQPLLRRVEPNMEKHLKEMARKAPSEKARTQMKNTQIDMEITFTNWKLNPEIPENQFAFIPPEDAAEKDSLFEGRSRSNSGSGEEDHALTGKSAPEFSLETLDGETVDIKKHVKQDILILDFWATWCPPCRRALPKVAEVADNYKEKGVRFFAINQRESKEKIKSFLKDAELDIPVLLDKKGNVGDKYQVEGIPQTVLIGPDGKVQTVHVGAAPNLKEQLSKELDTLLEGKDLAGGSEKDDSK